MYSCLVSGASQVTLTGSDWRHAVAYWPGMVAGLLGPRPDGSVAPCAATPRQSKYGARRRKKAKGGKDEQGRGGTKRKRASPPAPSLYMAAVVAGDETDTDGETWVHDPVAPVDRNQSNYKNAFGSMPLHDAVLEVVCRAAVLVGHLCGDNVDRGLGMLQSEAEALGDEAYEFLTKYVAALLGASHNSKVHRLAYHLLMALMFHGNLTEGDTSVNEMIHKLCKVMYSRTNKKVDGYTLQMLRCEQTLSLVLDEARAEMAAMSDAPAARDAPAAGDAPDAGEDPPRVEADADGVEEDAEASEADDMAALRAWDGGEDLLSDADGTLDSGDEDMEWGGSKSDGPAKRLSGMRVNVVALAAGMAGGVLAGLGALLGVQGGEVLVVRTGAWINPVCEWGAELKAQRIHTTKKNHGAPWYDHVRYKDPAKPEDILYGHAQLSIFAVGGNSVEALVVQRLVPATAHPDCVRTRFHAQRLRWAMEDGAMVPALAVVLLKNVCRLEQIEPDMAPLTERSGMFFKPDLPQTAGEWRSRRFFINPHHTWTSAPQLEL